MALSVCTVASMPMENTGRWDWDSLCRTKMAEAQGSSSASISSQSSCSTLNSSSNSSKTPLVIQFTYDSFVARNESGKSSAICRYCVHEKLSITDSDSRLGLESDSSHVFQGLGLDSDSWPKDSGLDSDSWLRDSTPSGGKPSKSQLVN